MTEEQGWLLLAGLWLIAAILAGREDKMSMDIVAFLCAAASIFFVVLSAGA